MQTLDLDYFFSTTRKTIFKGRILTKQLKGAEAILARWQAVGHTDKRWLAYMLATAWHETAHTFEPLEEYGKGRGKDYGKMLKMGKFQSGANKGKRIPYSSPNKIFYGRGLVQLTWYENYQLMGRLLGIDLLNFPEKALDLKTSVDIMYEGMLRGASSFGDFTGRSLEQYFNTAAKIEDWEGARKIINGEDKKELIANYGRTFNQALRYLV